MTSTDATTPGPQGVPRPATLLNTTAHDESTRRLEQLDAGAVREAAPWDAAIAALEHALLTEVDPERDTPRLSSEAPNGEFLLMPSAARSYSGVKALTVSPGNPARGLEKIQGVYILFDSNTLTPLATLDGAEITAIRTPAVSLLAIKHIIKASLGGEPWKSPRILAFGNGVQSLNHIRAAHHLYPQADIAVAGRHSARLEEFRDRLALEGIRTSLATQTDVPRADIIICSTSSAVPLFDGNEPAPHAVIAAVGAHGPGVREVDSALVLRSDVIVEGRTSTLREAGDLVPARSVEDWLTIQPVNLGELVSGQFVRTPGKPCLFNSVGMSWEDLAIAALVYERHTSR